MYAPTFFGLFFSKDVGTTWEQATGVFGHLQIMALAYADMGDHTILYAATDGGQVAATGGTAGATSRMTADTAGTFVGAGIYRYVVVTPKLTLKLSGLASSFLRLGRLVTATGVVTPTSLAGGKLTLTVQRLRNGHWLTVARLTRTISATGTYKATYKPAKRGSYRIRTTIAKSATNMSAQTVWHMFKVR